MSVGQPRRERRPQVGGGEGGTCPWPPRGFAAELPATLQSQPAISSAAGAPSNRGSQLPRREGPPPPLPGACQACTPALPPPTPRLSLRPPSSLQTTPCSLRRHRLSQSVPAPLPLSVFQTSFPDHLCKSAPSAIALPAHQLQPPTQHLSPLTPEAFLGLSPRKCGLCEHRASVPSAGWSRCPVWCTGGGPVFVDYFRKRLGVVSAWGQGIENGVEHPDAGAASTPLPNSPVLTPI